MSLSYLPGTDAGLADWALNFDTKITAAPGTYGLTALQAGVYGGLRTAYATALATATNPTTRGGSTIFAKNQAKKSLISASRELAAIVQAFPGTTDQMRYDLQLTVRKTPPSPVPVTSEVPLIDLKKVSGYTASIRLHAAGNRRGKPVNVAGAGVYGYVGPNAPTSEQQWTLLMNTTETSVDVTFGQQPAPGSTVWLTARWYNPKIEYGPAAEPVGTNLPGFGPGQQGAAGSPEVEGLAPIAASRKAA
ncbi:MAG: hypothetical protein IT446_02570 [Phycisphaerales bacterium]|nr:hypothetical protein [Phycisphaerales bacterium]